MSEKLMFISAFQYNAIYSKDSGIAITTPVIESDKYEALQSQLDEANKVIEHLAQSPHPYTIHEHRDNLEHRFGLQIEVAQAYLEKYKEKV